MIGFKLKASGSHGFKWESNPWTEGSLMFLRMALIVGDIQGGISMPRGSVVKGVENAFAAPKYQLLNQVANLGLKLQLAVSGDASFVHYFEKSKPGHTEVIELARKFADAKFGEQVVIHLCRSILDFRMHVLNKNQTHFEGGLWMFVEINL